MVARIDSQMLDFFFRISPPERKDLLASLRDAPVRKSAIHKWLGDNSPILRIAKVLMSQGIDERFRLQAYPDLGTETQYKLMAFGIPTDIPITSSGTIKPKNHLKWIKMRKAIEEEREKGESGSTIGIQYPANTDVLFERGGGRVSHFGNIEFTLIMEAKLREIKDESTKLGKKICDDVINEVRSRDGRFLEKDLHGRGWWVEIEDSSVLYKKIGASLYDHQRRLRARRNDEVELSSESSRLSVSHMDRGSTKRLKTCHGCFCA